MKKYVSFIIAALLALGAIAAGFGGTASASTVQPFWNVPAGYNAHDYNKLAAFLEIADSNGVKNGVKCGTNYNPNDPTTWGRTGSIDDPENPVEPVTFTWIEQGGEKRISEITCYGVDVVGALDLSGCSYLYSANFASNRLTALNVSQCTSLVSLICSANSISTLNVGGCSELMTLTCGGNALSSLNIETNSKLRSLTVSGNPIGTLNLSSNPDLVALNCTNCALTSLNLSAQSKLLGLYCAENMLTSLNLSTATKLQYVNCRANRLSQLNVSACTMLLGLNCDSNELASLNLSSNILLMYLSCLENRLTSLDVSATRIGISSVNAETGGTIGLSAAISSLGNENMPALDNSVHAYPSSGYTFTGWYAPSGELISDQQSFVITGSNQRSFTARFSQGTNPPAANGDVDGNGTVSVADSVLALRHSIGISTLTAEQIARGDMDGNGNISVADAIAILRMTMGL